MGRARTKNKQGAYKQQLIQQVLSMTAVFPLWSAKILLKVDLWRSLWVLLVCDTRFSHKNSDTRCYRDAKPVILTGNSALRDMTTRL